MLRLRLVQTEEFESVMHLIDQGKAHLKAQGINQWQNGYPNAESIQKDIEAQRGYFIVSDQSALQSTESAACDISDTGDIVLGYMCVDFNGEPAYEIIDGAWLTNGEYGVVHRLVLDDAYRGTGLSGRVFKLVEELCKKRLVHSIKIDTSVENKKMQHVLLQNGFTYCGIVYLPDGERRAYEKLVY